MFRALPAVGLSHYVAKKIGRLMRRNKNISAGLWRYQEAVAVRARPQASDVINRCTGTFHPESFMTQCGACVFSRICTSAALW
jgi:anthranilate/para-aminobenzoate synthase component II